jgi:hypothetical protein
MTEFTLPPGTADVVVNRLFRPVDRYKNDPVGWIQRFAFVWSKQAEICEAVRDHRYTAVRACHGPGKSFIAAWIACWWMDTHEDAVVITSAPSGNQVKNILWKEIRRAHAKAGLEGYITGSEIPEWKMNGEVVAFGRKPADYKDADQASTSFQGIHAKHVLVILDEGSGIPDWLANATESIVTNEYSRVLIIGNPDNPNSYFARMSKPGSGYHNIKISAWDLPAFTGEPVPPEVEAVLTGTLWVEERRRRWGEGSVLWTSKVEAEFPSVSEDTLFTPAIISRGIETERVLLGQGVTGTAGMDVARLGADETVVYWNRNGYVRLKARWGKFDTMETVGKYRALWDHPGGTEIPGAVPPTWIDVTGGTGAGPFDRLREAGFPVYPLNASEKANDPTKYLNRRAEMYWEAKEAMEDGTIDIDVLDEDLQHELLAHKFKYNSTGRIQILSKEEVTKEIGHSPDRADAFVMSLQRRGDWAKALGVSADSISPGSREPDAEDLIHDLMDISL